jgi:serine protease Do
MFRYLVNFLLAATFLPVPFAAAENFKLSGSKKWLAVVSTKDVNSAIGIARTLGDGAQVVLSQSGYYGVIKGPYTANSIEEVKKIDATLYDLPKDALLSNGARYISSVWASTSTVGNLTEYSDTKAAQFSNGDLTAKVEMKKIGDDTYSTFISGQSSDAVKFSFTAAAEGDYATMGANAGILKLDSGTKSNQLLVTRYSGGAHCCTNSWIITKPNGAAGFAMIDAGKLDGGGYWFEDVDGDGTLELMSVDNSFLYAFDSYAGSIAPLKIAQLHNGAIEDVSDRDIMKPRIVQDLAGMEYGARLNPELWKSNGFLVGWLANKLRLGQGDEGWQTLVENVDKTSSFGPQECVTGQSIEDCPVEKLKAIPILKAIASFMKEGGYGPLPDAAEAMLN